MSIPINKAAWWDELCGNAVPNGQALQVQVRKKLSSERIFIGHRKVCDRNKNPDDAKDEMELIPEGRGRKQA